MPATRVHYDGIDRQAIIRAIMQRWGHQRPTQAAMGRLLGISQSAVAYHMRKIRELG